MRTRIPAQLEGNIKGVSVPQPWASLIAHGYIDYIARPWVPPPPLGFPLAIHASKAWTKAQEAALRDQAVAKAVRSILTRQNQHGGRWGPGDGLPLGALVGTARLVACRPIHEGKFLVATQQLVPVGLLGSAMVEELGGQWGRWAWMLEDVEPIRWPIPYRGGTRLWEVGGR